MDKIIFTLEQVYGLWQYLEQYRPILMSQIPKLTFTVYWIVLHHLPVP